MSDLVTFREPTADALLRMLREWQAMRGEFERWRARPPREFVLNQPELCKIMGATDRDTSSDYAVVRVGAKGNALPGETVVCGVTNIRETDVARIASYSMCPLYQLPDGELYLDEDTSAPFWAEISSGPNAGGFYALRPLDSTGAVACGTVQLSRFEFSLDMTTLGPGISPTDMGHLANLDLTILQYISDAISRADNNHTLLIPLVHGYGPAVINASPWVPGSGGYEDWAPSVGSRVWASVQSHGARRITSYIANLMGTFT